MHKKKIFIADDHRIFAEGLKLLIEDIEGYEVAGVEQNGSKVIERINETKADILMLDLNMPGKSGIEVLKEIRESGLKVKIVVLTTYNDYNLVDITDKLGGDAYMLKSADKDELMECLNSLDKKGIYVGKKVKTFGEADKLFNDKFEGKIKLTNREAEIACLIVKGYTTSDIGKELFISVNTIETHRKNIFRKLNIKNVTELIHFAYEHKIL